MWAIDNIWFIGRIIRMEKRKQLLLVVTIPALNEAATISDIVQGVLRPIDAIDSITFGSRNPGKSQTVIFQTECIENILYNCHAATCVIITNLVMTISRMSATNQYTISSP